MKVFDEGISPIKNLKVSDEGKSPVSNLIARYERKDVNKPRTPTMKSEVKFTYSKGCIYFVGISLYDSNYKKIEANKKINGN